MSNNREPLADHIAAAERMFGTATKDNVMDIARMFAAAMLASSEMKAGPRPLEGTEAIPNDVNRHGTPNDRIRRDTAGADDNTIDRYQPLKSVAEDINEDRALDGDEEFAPNSADENDVLAKIAALVKDRR